MLTIKNWNKLIGETFVDGRFLFSNFVETGTKLQFWFKDLNSNNSSYGIWVDIERQGQYEPEYGYKMYKVIYPKGGEHRIGANWFGDIDNARWTFETALKAQ